MNKPVTFCVFTHPDANKKSGKPLVKIICVSFLIGLIGYGVLLQKGITEFVFPSISQAELNKKISIRQNEIEHQRQQIQKFAKEINSLKSELASLNEFEQRLRIISNLENPDHSSSIFGIGGAISDDLDPGTELRQTHNFLIREMHDQINELNHALAIQKNGFESLFVQIKNQRNIFAVTPSIRPTRGIVTSGFGKRYNPITKEFEFHKALDIANDFGTPVIAPANGTVTFAEWKNLYGNMIVIHHGHGIVTRYAHLEKILKNPGDFVERGEVIGLMGSTGRSTGPHLHYEVHINSAPVDPEKYIMN